MWRVVLQTIETADQRLTSPDMWSKSENNTNGRMSLLQALPFGNPRQFMATLRFLASTLSTFKGWNGDHMTMIDFNSDPAIEFEHVKAFLAFAQQRLRSGIRHGLR